MRILLTFLLLFQFILGYCQKPSLSFHKMLSTNGTEAMTNEINCTSFSKDEKFLAACAPDGNLLIWDIETGKIHKNLFDAGTSFSAYDIKFSPDGKYLIAVGTFHPHKGIKVWNARNFELIKEIKYDTIRPYSYDKSSVISRNVLSLFFMPDSKHFITGDGDGMLMVWSTNKLKFISSKDAKNSNSCITGTSDGKQIITPGDEGHVSIWNYNKEKLIFKTAYKTSNFDIQSISVSSDDKFIITNTSDTFKTINLKNGLTDKILFVINDPVDYIMSVGFDRGGKYLVSGHTLNNFKIWSVETGEFLANFRGDISEAFGTEIYVKVLFSPSGKYIALSNDAGFI